MSQKKFKNLIVKKRNGLSLIEVIVAIAISIVTITGAAQFSLALMKNAQRNFMEESALEYQSLITEQLRFLDLVLQSDKKNPTTPHLSAEDKTGFCAQNQYKYFQINLPKFKANEENKINLNNLAGSDEDAVIIDGVTYNFGDFFNENNEEYERFGAFERSGENGESNVKISILKTVNPGSNPLTDFITLDVVVGYKVFGKFEYTTPTQVKIIYSLVCP